MNKQILLLERQTLDQFKQNDQDLLDDSTAWQTIEDVIRNELEIQFHIDFLKEFLEKHNHQIINQDALIKAIVTTMGPIPRKSDINAIIDYLLLYELLSEESQTTFLVTLGEDQTTIPNDHKDSTSITQSSQNVDFLHNQSRQARNARRRSV